MSFPGLPDRREQAFTEGWVQLLSDTYWDPRKGAWFMFHSTDYTISDEGIPSPDLEFNSPKQTFQLVEQSWSAIRAQHADAFFDPRQKGWRAITARTSKPPPDDLAKRIQRAKTELDALDAEYKAGVLNSEELDRRRREVRRKYQLE